MLRQGNALPACHSFQRRAGKRMDRDGFLPGARLILGRKPVAKARHAGIARTPVDIDPRQRSQRFRVRRLGVARQEFGRADRKADIMEERAPMRMHLGCRALGQAEHVVQELRLRLYMGGLKPERGRAVSRLETVKARIEPFEQQGRQPRDTHVPVGHPLGK